MYAATTQAHRGQEKISATYPSTYTPSAWQAGTGECTPSLLVSGVDVAGKEVILLAEYNTRSGIFALSDVPGTASCQTPGVRRNKDASSRGHGASAC